MILNIDKFSNRIEEDIKNNQTEIFNRYDHYSRKYSKYSDRLNDVNVGLFLNDNQQPTVQIFIRNRTGYTRKHIIFNREGNKIIDNIQLNYKINENIYN